MSGPWYVDTVRQVAGCNEDIAIVKDNGTLIAVAYARRQPDETLANACLIATAPEMYEALKAIVNDDFLKHFPRDSIEMAKKALAKTEGKEKTGD